MRGVSENSAFLDTFPGHFYHRLASGCTLAPCSLRTPSEANTMTSLATPVSRLMFAATVLAMAALLLPLPTHLARAQDTAQPAPAQPAPAQPAPAPPAPAAAQPAATETVAPATAPAAAAPEPPADPAKIKT